MRSRLAVLGAVIGVSATVLSGCGLDDSNESAEVTAGSVDPKALEGATIIVGSKDFDESILLGHLTLLMLKAAGAEVSDQTDIQGSTNVRNALIGGDIDIYWDYTGTGWITYLGQATPITDAQKQYEAVRDMDLTQNKLTWLPPAEFDNTYAIGIRDEKAKELGVETLSDLATLSKDNPAEATFCVEQEFASRPDGFTAMNDVYGIVPSNVALVETNVVYTETAKGETCNFGEVFATDGRIKGLGLTVLEDDKAFFPRYNGSIVLRQETAEEFPAIEEIMQPLVDKLDNDVMAALNTKVSYDEQDAATVAEEYLREEGFIS